MGAIGKIAGGIGKKVLGGLGGIGGGGCGSAGGIGQMAGCSGGKKQGKKKLMEIIAQLLNQAKGGCPGGSCG